MAGKATTVELVERLALLAQRRAEDRVEICRLIAELHERADSESDWLDNLLGGIYKKRHAHRLRNIHDLFERFCEDDGLCRVRHFSLDTLEELHRLGDDVFSFLAQYPLDELDFTRDQLREWRMAFMGLERNPPHRFQLGFLDYLDPAKVREQGQRFGAKIDSKKACDVGLSLLLIGQEGLTRSQREKQLALINQVQAELAKELS